MNSSTLQLPGRTAKPRQSGLTMAIDGGLPFGTLRDIVASAAEYLDFVKFGWGTAIVSGELSAKIDLLKANDIDYYFGGTLSKSLSFKAVSTISGPFASGSRAIMSKPLTAPSTCQTRRRQAMSVNWRRISRSSPKSVSRTPTARTA